MFIPFGKYKGERLDKIIVDDPNYIVWLSKQELNSPLKEEVEDLVEDAESYLLELDEGDINS